MAKQSITIPHCKLAVRFTPQGFMVCSAHNTQTVFWKSAEIERKFQMVQAFKDSRISVRDHWHSEHVYNVAIIYFHASKAL